MLALRNLLWYMGQKRNILMFDNLSYFWEDICRALPYFHALTGCDATSSFYQFGKAKFWKTWMKQHNNSNESLTRTFIHLGDEPTNIDLNDIDIIANIFTIAMVSIHLQILHLKPCVYASC